MDKIEKVKRNTDRQIKHQMGKKDNADKIDKIEKKEIKKERQIGR